MPETGRTRGRPPSGGREEILRTTLDVLRERGVAKLTTREVAERAGVSEGSIYYHFADRAGLLQAVFEQALAPLRGLGSTDPASDVRATLTAASVAIEDFLGAGLDVLMAAQADADLLTPVHGFMDANDYGPHRGVSSIGAYLAAQQRAGAVRADVNPKVVAWLVINDAFQRASLPKLVGHAKGVPSRKAFFDTVMTMLGD